MAPKPFEWTDQNMLDALVMRDVDGMTSAQIGAHLGTSRASVLGMFKRIADDEKKAAA